MKRILLTGMSGNGKSTVIDALAGRGYRAIDLDQPGWSVHAADGDWIWNEVRVRALLESESDDLLFVSGCAENQVKFYPLLDHIILLSAPADVIVERIRTRTSNDYGKAPEELAAILYHLETVEPLLRRTAGHEIDTSMPLDQVVATVLQIVEA